MIIVNHTNNKIFDIWSDNVSVVYTINNKHVVKQLIDLVQPKPSSTVMLYKLLHNMRQQRLGYKTTLFFKYYRRQLVKKPIQYWRNFNKQWQQSMFWTTKLKQSV